jgi:hypothetical protein
MPDNSTFCTSCGAKIQDGQAVANPNNGANRMAQPNTSQNFTSQSFQSQAYAGQPLAPRTGMGGQKNKTPLFIAFGAAGVVGLVLLIFIIKAIFGGGGAEGYVRNVFKAINNQDAELLMKLAPEDELEDFNDLDKDEREDALEEAEDYLDSINDQFEERYGKSWYKNIEISESDTDKEKGKTLITFDVEIKGVDDYDDFEEEITVIKEDGKYYIEDMPF